MQKIRTDNGTRRWSRMMPVLLSLLLFFSGGCAGSEMPAPSPESKFPAESQAPQTAEASASSYEVPPFLDCSYHAALAEGTTNAGIDISSVSEGYVAVSAISDKRLKFQIKFEENKYNFDLASDGTPSFFPLSFGDGDYLFRIMENITENKYAEKLSVSCQVRLKDEFQPYLHPSDYVNYSRDSDCVRKASELAENASDELELISGVYDFICTTVTYDHEKARHLENGYLPDPDETMHSGKGICFDYASLAAAMLRSQGIPTKEIFGYVAPDDVYHAWNMFYTKENGWITVSFAANQQDWTRMDVTFAANGADSTFIGDGTNYSELYFY